MEVTISVAVGSGDVLGCIPSERLQQKNMAVLQALASLINQQNHCMCVTSYDYTNPVCGGVLILVCHAWPSMVDES